MLDLSFLTCPVGGYLQFVSAIREEETADVERIKGIGDVGSVLQWAFFGLREFLRAFILTVIIHTGIIHRDEKIFTVDFVEMWFQTFLTSASLCEGKMSFALVHRLTDVDIVHLPSAFLEGMDDDPSVVFIINGRISHLGCMVPIEYDLM